MNNLNETAKDGGCKIYLNEGDGFYKVAKGGVNKPEKFSTETLYNLIGMAIEKYLMAYFIYKKQMPQNHTFFDLVANLKELGEYDKVLFDDIKKMDRFQNLCSLEVIDHKPVIEKENILTFLNVCERVKEYVLTRMPENAYS